MVKTKIAYTILGEGLGHSIRSIPIIIELRKRYSVDVIVTSKRAYDFMKASIQDIKYIEGPGFIYENNKVNIIKTLKKNYHELIPLFLNVGESSSFEKIVSFIKRSDPEVIVTDFELLTLATSDRHNIPIICVCNNHSMTNFKYNAREFDIYIGNGYCV